MFQSVWSAPSDFIDSGRKCRLLLYPLQLVAWSSSCSHWWFARLVCSFLTACQHAPGMGSLWDQGLALHQPWRAMSHSSSSSSLWLQLCLLHLCLDCVGDGDFHWVHMLWQSSAQPQAWKSPSVSPQSFYTAKEGKSITFGIFCYAINNSLFI